MSKSPATSRRTLRAILADRLAERRAFATTTGWLWSLYDRALNRKPALRLGRGSVRRVRIPNQPRPFFLRLGSSDWLVLKEIFADGEYKALGELDPRSIRSIVDLGANIGLSVRLWQQMFTGARIVAVEPDAGNMNMCRRNATSPPSPSPEPHFASCCVAGVHRKVTMDHSGGEWAFKMRDAAGTADAMDALTLPEILAQAGLEGPIDLLKCDIEGAEVELFAHAAPWIGRVENLVVELHAPYTVERFQADLAAADPRPWRLRTLSSSHDLAVVFARRQA